jgi:hypothetical protein
MVVWQGNPGDMLFTIHFRLQAAFGGVADFFSDTLEQTAQFHVVPDFKEIEFNRRTAAVEDQYGMIHA